MGIHYKEEQYRKIIPTAFEFWSRCRNKGLTYNKKSTGPIGNQRVALTYCPANHTYHLYDINRRLVLLFRKLELTDIPKNTANTEVINENVYEWNITFNSYKEGISTVILLYDDSVQEASNEGTVWDITELREIMKKNFNYPLFLFR